MAEKKCGYPENPNCDCFACQEASREYCEKEEELKLRCSGCRFFDKIARDFVGQLYYRGHCKKKAPDHEHTPTGTKSTSCWPVVDNKDKCGDFEQGEWPD